jgi:hypothetical protein
MTVSHDGAPKLPARLYRPPASDVPKNAVTFIRASPAAFALNSM